MSTLLQKQRERFLFDQFLETSGLKARTVEEREAPDFLICLDGRKVGIELTELFISHSTSAGIKQIQESISNKIIAHAQRLYEKTSASPAHVSVGFYPLMDLKPLNRTKTAEQLSAFVRDLNLAPWQFVNFDSEELEKSGLPEEIAFIHALGVPSHKMAHWAIPRAEWAAPLTIQILQARIEEKSKKLKEYQKIVPENWLIIIADFTKPSQLFNVSLEFDPSIVISPFTKTFFYGYPDRILIELGVAGSGQPLAS